MFEGRVFQSERVELRAASSVSKTLPGSGPGISRSITHEAYCTLYSAPDYGQPGPESETWFDEDPFLGWVKYFDLYSYASFSETDTATGPDVLADVSGYSLEIEPLGISASGAPGSYSDSVEAAVEIDDYKLYVHNSGVWIVRFSEIRLYFNGGLIQTWTGPFELMGTTVLNPWSMPFIGVYPKLHGTVAVSWSQGFPNVGPFSTVPFDWDGTAEAEQTIGGGIRFRQDSSWFAWNVAAGTPSYPSIGSGCGTAIPGSVTASDTWSTTLTQSASRREAGAFCTEEDPNVTGRAVIRRDVWSIGTSSTAAVWLWPDLERAIERATGADYKAIWYRWGFPWAIGRGMQSWESHSGPFPSIPPDDQDSGVTDVTVLDALTAMLSTVGESAHTIEAPLAESLPMPTLLGGSYARQQEASDTVTYQGIRLGDYFPISGGLYTGLPPACPNPAFSPPNACFANISWEYPYRVQRVDDSSGNIPNVFRHRHPLVRLWLWFNPLWGLGLWFPPDSADESVQWKVEGAPANAKLYWLRIAQQHLTHPALPPEEDVRTRNFVLSEPLLLSRLRDLYESHYFDQQTSPIGISRFEAIAPAAPSSITLDADSEDAWSFQDCSAAFGADIEVDADGTGPGTAVLKLDIGRFTDSAYQYPYLCKSVYLDWTDTNVDEVRVYLESYTGKRVLLEQTPGDGFTAKNVVYDLPRSEDEKYALSNAQDFGGGYIETRGYDALPTGISETIVGEPERTLSVALHPWGHGVYLRFEIDVEDRAAPVNIDYPRWERQAEEPTLIVECSSVGALLHPDGPGARIGQFNHWHEGFDSFIVTPRLRLPNMRMTALDGLCIKREVFDGVHCEDGLDTEIASIYEGGIEYTQRAHLARDPIEQRQTTHAFFWQGDTEPVLAMVVSSLREPPPLAGFPFRKRDADWQPTGDHAQVSYSWIVEPRRHVMDGTDELHLHEPGGSAVTSAGTAPSGWTVTEHSEPVDGTELPDWELRADGVLISRQRPWDGVCAAYLVEETEEAGGVSYDVSLNGRHLVAWIDSDLLVRIRRSANLQTLQFSETTTLIGKAVWVCIRCDRRSDGQRWLLAVEQQDGTFTLYETTSEGRSFTPVTTIDPGTKPTLFISRHDRNIYVYWIDGTAIKGQVLGADLSVIVPTFTAVASGVEDKGFGADESVLAGGERHIKLIYVSAGNVAVVDSTDGISFS